MNKRLVDFSRGIKSVNIQKYRSRSDVNIADDMAKITICMNIRENRALYNALKYDYTENSECLIDLLSSRACEYGTRGCIVHHE